MTVHEIKKKNKKVHFRLLDWIDCIHIVVLCYVIGIHWDNMKNIIKDPSNRIKVYIKVGGMTDENK